MNERREREREREGGTVGIALSSHSSLIGGHVK